MPWHLCKALRFWWYDNSLYYRNLEGLMGDYYQNPLRLILVDWYHHRVSNSQLFRG